MPLELGDSREGAPGPPQPPPTPANQQAHCRLCEARGTGLGRLKLEATERLPHGFPPTLDPRGPEPEATGRWMSLPALTSIFVTLCSLLPLIRILLSIITLGV